MYFFSLPADWPTVEVDSLSSNKRDDGLIIRPSRRVYPPATCRLNVGITEPTSIKVPLDKVEPRTDPEVSEDLDECRRHHVFIILEMYYMSAVFVRSLITVIVLASQCPHYGTIADGTKRKPKGHSNLRPITNVSKNTCLSPLMRQRFHWRRPGVNLKGRWSAASSAFLKSLFSIFLNQPKKNLEIQWFLLEKPNKKFTFSHTTSLLTAVHISLRNRRPTSVGLGR